VHRDLKPLYGDRDIVADLRHLATDRDGLVRKAAEKAIRHLDKTKHD
jgi:hypothetical protein